MGLQLRSKFPKDPSPDLQHLHRIRIHHQIQILLPIPDLSILQLAILGQHPQTGAEYLQVRLLQDLQGEFPLLSYEGLACDPDDVSSTEWQLVLGFGVFHGQLQLHVL